MEDEKINKLCGKPKDDILSIKQHLQIIKFEADKTKKETAHYKSRKDHKWHIILCMMFPLTVDLKQVSLSYIEMLLSKLSSTNTIPAKISNNT